MKNSIIIRIAAVSAAVSALSAWMTPAEGEKRDRIDDFIDNVYLGEWTDYEPDRDRSDDEVLPSKFDLRDVDGVCYVPEVRCQNPFGTCWSFGAIAAAEISLAYEADIDLNTASEEQKEALDLSEKHLAWFSYTPLPEDAPFCASQSGEGYHYTEYDEGLDTDEETRLLYDFGGYAHYAAVLFSEGVGPTYESTVPYISRDGKWNISIYTITVTDDDYQESDYRYDSVEPDKEAVKAYIEDYAVDHPGIMNYDTDYNGQNGVYYAITVERCADGDWSVDEDERFQSIFLKHSNILPSPSMVGPDSEYMYNEDATIAIKKELLAGRGVAVDIMADHSTPGYTDDSDNMYLSFYTSEGTPATYMDEADIWAHYTYCPGYDPSDPYSGNYCMGSNHVVCIVGYDDDFPKEYFYDPNGTIGGNGAWIARNSWGSQNNSDPTANYFWGNGGDGYFYISYYDQSLDAAESYEFDISVPDDEGWGLELYDLFPGFNYQVSVSDDPVYMANVFYADDDEKIRDVGIMTALPDLKAKISVYLLDDGAVSPVDGERVTGAEGTFEYKGYHTMRLDKEISVDEGQRYSVVLELIRGDGKYVFEINSAENKTFRDTTEEWRREVYLEEYGTLDGYVDNSAQYGVMVVNEGESWLGAGDGKTTGWRDLTKVIEEFRKIDAGILGGEFNDYDNFPIRSYPYANIFEVRNFIVNEKPEYGEGDVIEGRLTVTNCSALESYENIDVICSLVDLGEAGSIPLLGPAEMITIDYTYIVTGEDLGSGSLTSEVTVFKDNENWDLNEEYSVLKFEVKVADKEPDAAPEDGRGDSGDIQQASVITENVPVSIPGDSSDPVQTAESRDPVLPVLFIVIGAVVLIAAGITVAVIVTVRKKNR